MTNLDTDQLLELCRQGDDLAWEALVRRFQGRVFSVAWHYTRNKEEARDAAQDVFIQVYRKLDELDQGRAFVPWLLRIARNRSIDRLRRENVRTPETEVPVDEAQPMAAPEPGTDEAVWHDDRRRLLDRALATMSEGYRELIVLKEIQEMKLEEIADLLGLPIGTVKSRSHRARIALAEAVRELDPSYGA